MLVLMLVLVLLLLMIVDERCWVVRLLLLMLIGATKPALDVVWLTDAAVGSAW